MAGKRKCAVAADQAAAEYHARRDEARERVRAAALTWANRVECILQALADEVSESLAKSGGDRSLLSGVIDRDRLRALKDAIEEAVCVAGDLRVRGDRGIDLLDLPGLIVAEEAELQPLMLEFGEARHREGAGK